MLTSAVRMRNHHLLFEHLLNIAASPSGAGTGDRVPVASGAAGPHDLPGSVRRPILAVAVLVALVVRDQFHRVLCFSRSRSSGPVGASEYQSP